ncbi:hypothetical protein PQX77_017495 [Marasmius sp. AFHP31]|nr:hypothetical protein PQX77_017495 [Marasmius sp. AFHP31]
MEFGIDTPFSRVLNTNYAPSNEERRSIWDLIRGPEEQIRQLDEEISRLQAKRQMLKRFVDLHRALLSPFRRIPADVWRLVFIETLPENILGLCTRTTKNSPLLLTTICRSWREIALSTPSLWNSIHIHLPRERSNTHSLEYVTRLHQRKEGLEAWLDRSGSLPITISLAAETYYDPERPYRSTLPISSGDPRALTLDFIELLTQYSHRWRTVVFDRGIHQLDLTPLEQLTTNSLSSLESFCSFGALSRFGQQENANVNHNASSRSLLVNLLTEARSLRRLELFHEYISAATLSLPIPWHHLTELSIVLPVLYDWHSSLDPAGQLMQVLAAKCHSLTTLTIIFGGFYTSANATISHPVQWPSLQNLRIAFLDGALWYVTAFTSEGTHDDDESRFDPAVIQIFDSVTLPSLKKLSVGFYGLGEDVDSDRKQYAAQLPFEGLLQRSQCPLTHLEIFGPRIVLAKAVIRVLQQLETLVSLNLGYGRLAREKMRQSFTRVPGRTNRNVAQTWRRDWLDRILREFVQAGLGEDIESQADAFAVLPLCPRLEELNIGGCAIDDRDMLLDFATRIRRADLGTFRVDLGRPLRDDVWKIFESLQMQRQDSEVMRVTRDLGGVMLDWRWEETSEDPTSIFDTATTGLPEEESWLNESLWL